MRVFPRPARRCAAIAAASAALSLTLPAPAHAGISAFATYGQSWREIDLPTVGAGSFGVAVDVMPDGRLIAATGLDVFVETAVRSGVFARAATLDAAIVDGSTDPSFLRVSPDGARVALGAGFGKPIIVFDASALSTSTPATIDAASSAVFDVNHASAAWTDAANLAITAGTFGEPSMVTLLDATSDPASPTNPVIIDNIGGATGGVALDGAGRLFTANGFDLGPGGTDTGVVKAFEPGAWSAATPAPDFEAAGAFIIDILSGASLAFDDASNLFVGGGDAFGSGETGFVAVVRAGAVERALAGFGPVDPLSPSDVRRLDPLGDGSGFFAALFNQTTGELLVQSGDQLFATIPAPGVWTVALLACAAGAHRRMRHAAA